MKTAIVFLLGAALTEHASETKKKVYEQAGQAVVIAFPSDYHFPDTVDGQTYTSDCNVSSGNVSCTDKSVFVTVKLDNGGEASFNSRCRMDLDVEHRFDPLSDVIEKSLKIQFDSKEHVLATFPYRLEPKLRFAKRCGYLRSVHRNHQEEREDQGKRGLLRPGCVFTKDR